MSVSKFELDVSKVAAALEIDAAEMLSWTGIKMQDDLTKMTPRDTGRASASWNLVSGNDPDESVRRPGIYAPGKIGNRRASATSIRKHDMVLSLSNNIVYIVPLEDGHSRLQAPNGFFAITVARFRRYMRQSLREAKKA